MPSSARERLSRTWRTITESVFPPGLSCALCGHEIDPARQDTLCSDCEDRIRVIGEERCERCGALCPDLSDLCLKCTYELPHFELARSWADYTGPARELILAYKESNCRYLAGYLARRLLEVYERGELCKPDLVTCVPASRLSARRRGFAHTELLAQEFCLLAELEFSPVLERVRETAPQKSVKHRDREENVRGSFSVNAETALKGKNILLIDDLKTTGATVGECADVLKRAGAARVEVLTCASVAPVYQSM